MSRELQKYFNIEYIHAADVLEGVSFVATILETLKTKGFIDYTAVQRALVIGYGNGHELWLLQQLGIPFIVGIDDDSMPAWSVVRDNVLAKIPNVHVETGHTFTRWLREYDGEPFDLMITIQAPAGFWDGVDWNKASALLTDKGVFVIDSDDDPVGHGLSPDLTLTPCVLDFSIDFPSPINGLTNGRTTIYEARERMGFKRNVVIITKQIPRDINETSAP